MYAAKSGTIAGSGNVEQGVTLAKQRRAALRELIISDPAMALEASIATEVRELLPQAITNELETPVYGTGDLMVVCAMPEMGRRELPEIQRSVRLDGHTYRAYVYGRRETETTKLKIPLHGVALDGVLALHESVLSELDSVRAAQNTEPVVDVSKTAGVLPGSGAARLARLGKTVYRFASLEHLQRCEAILEKAESDSPAEPVQSAAEVLEHGLVAKHAQEKANHLRIAASSVKKVLVIRVDFADLPGDPSYPAFQQPFTAGYVQTIADTQIVPYYLSSSYGAAHVAFTVTPGVYRLPKTAAYYAQTDSVYALHDDAVAAAQGDYAMTDYEVVAVLFSYVGFIPNNQFHFSGLTQMGQGKVLINGEFDFRVVAHELGHTYGLFYHANVWETTDGNPISGAGTSVEYGDIFDTIGGNPGNSRGVDFNPWFKYLLNWITDDQVQTVTTNGVYRVYRFDDAAATGTLALRIVKDQERTYWIGCRRNFTQNSTMSHGAYVDWGYPNTRQSNLLCLGQTPNDVRGAALPLGGALADAEANLTVTVTAEGGTPPRQYIDVQVTFAPPPVILAQHQSQELLEGQDAEFSVSATGNPAPTYSWQYQASGATNWVALSDLAGCSGANSPTLVINSPTVSMTGAAFRCVLTNSAGGFNCSSPVNLTIDRFGMSTLAGQPGVAGYADGTGWLAQFNAPMGIAVDIAGNSYVADSGNHVVRKITLAGVVSTLAGAAGNPGSTDGVGSDARFNGPVGIAVDTSGTVYVTDQNNSTIRKITPDGTVTTLAGVAGSAGAADGVGSEARFAFPSGIAVDCFGNLFVADTGNETVRKLTPDGQVITLAGLAGTAGSADGQGANARFNHPAGIAIDLAGNLYVADQQNATVRKIGGRAEVTTLAGTAGVTGNADGIGPNAQFSSPTGLAVDTAGTVFVADGTNSIRKVTSTGVVSSMGPAPGTQNNGTVAVGTAVLISPTDAAVDSRGSVYVADGSAIRLIRSGSAPAPLLSMNNVAGQIILSWPASASNFTLETRSDLSPSGSWTAVTGQPSVVGCSLVITNEPQNPAAFYRLHSR